MDKIELMKVYSYAELLWKTFKPEDGEVKSKLQDSMWFDFLKPYNLETIYAAMRECARQSDFCNIAKVAKECETITGLTQNLLYDEEKIFIEIDKAIDYYNSKEKFEKLSNIAKSVVGDPCRLAAWSQCESDEFNTVIASQIRRGIRNKIEVFKKIETLKKESPNLLTMDKEQKKMIDI